MDEYIRLDTTAIGIDNLIAKASNVEEANALFKAKDVIYSQQRYLTYSQPEPPTVKHGRWEVNEDRFYPFCSNCKYEPPKELIRCNALSLEPILTKYCPNCGSENGTKIYRGR